MKTSTMRFILAATCLFPAMLMCLMWSIGAVAGLVFKGDLSAIPFGFPFISCLVVWGWFVKDTMALYKEGL